MLIPILRNKYSRVKKMLTIAETGQGVGENSLYHLCNFSENNNYSKVVYLN